MCHRAGFLKKAIRARVIGQGNSWLFGGAAENNNWKCGAVFVGAQRLDKRMRLSFAEIVVAEQKCDWWRRFASQVCDCFFRYQERTNVKRSASADHCLLEQ